MPFYALKTFTPEAVRIGSTGELWAPGQLNENELLDTTQSGVPYVCRSVFGGSIGEGANVYQNKVANPSFEYDTPGGTPFYWQQYSTTAGGPTLLSYGVLNNVPAASGSYNMWVNASYPGFSGDRYGIKSVQPGTGTAIAVTAGVTYCYRSVFNIIANNANGEVAMRVIWYDKANKLLTSQQMGTHVTGIFAPEALYTAPAEATQAWLLLYGTNINNSAVQIAFGVDAILFAPSNIALPYRDGDYINSCWTGTAGRSATNFAY